MDGELAYFASLSGLVPAEAFSVADHIVAAGLDVYPNRDYFTALSGLTPAEAFSYSDHRRAVFDGGGSPPPAPFELTFRQTAVDSTDGTVFTFPAQPIGAASATRRVIVGYVFGGSSNPVLSNATIGGVTATIDADSGAITGSRRVYILSAVVPTGTTADVVITISPGTVTRSGIAVWTLPTGAPTGQTAVSINLDAGVLNTTTTAGEVVVAVGVASINNTPETIDTTWFLATERFDVITAPGELSTYLTGADTVAVGALTEIDYSVAYQFGAQTKWRGFVAAAYAE